MKKVTRANFEGLRQRCPVLNKEEMRHYVGGNFILYDENRNLAAVHEAGHRCVLVSGEQLQIPQGHMDYFAVLWKQYFATMEIRERHNEQCQNHLLPKWYRKYMTEWN